MLGIWGDMVVYLSDPYNYISLNSNYWNHIGTVTVNRVSYGMRYAVHKLCEEKVT